MSLKWYTFRIDYISISNNVVKGMNMHVEKRLKAMERNLVKANMNIMVDQIPEAIKGEKRAMAILSFRSKKRMLDPDNYVGGLKYIIDALRKEGALYDDEKKCYIDRPEFEQVLNIGAFQNCLVICIGVDR